MDLIREADIDPAPLAGKRVAILGYGNQGRAQSLNLNDSGIDVVVGLRGGSGSAGEAEAAGLEIALIADAVRLADVVMMLAPDEIHPALYREIEPNLRDGAAKLSHVDAAGREEQAQDARVLVFLEGELGAQFVGLEVFGGRAPGRANVVARFEGSDPGRDALLIHGHLDVVPADPSEWSVDPFGGEIKDGDAVKVSAGKQGLTFNGKAIKQAA